MEECRFDGESPADCQARCSGRSENPSLVHLGEWGIAQIEHPRCRIEKGTAFLQKIHPDDPVHRAAGAIPEGATNRAEGSHRDLEFAYDQLAEDDVVEDRTSDGSAVTGGINDLGS